MVLYKVGFPNASTYDSALMETIIATQKNTMITPKAIIIFFLIFTFFILTTLPQLENI